MSVILSKVNSSTGKCADFDIPPYGYNRSFQTTGSPVTRRSAKPCSKARDITGGAPIGAKIGAGKYMEKDLEYLCESGVDFITVDGAEAATKGSPPIFQDDFGIPTVFAIHRAAQWIRNNGYQDQVSLLVSGKIRTPGEVLKACALGADACYMGSIALFAVSHSQLNKALPMNLQLLWFGIMPLLHHFDR